MRTSRVTHARQRREGRHIHFHSGENEEQSSGNAGKVIGILLVLVMTVGIIAAFRDLLPK